MNNKKLIGTFLFAIIFTSPMVKPINKNASLAGGFTVFFVAELFGLFIFDSHFEEKTLRNLLTNNNKPPSIAKLAGIAAITAGSAVVGLCVKKWLDKKTPLHRYALAQKIVAGITTQLINTQINKTMIKLNFAINLLLKVLREILPDAEGINNSFHGLYKKSKYLLESIFLKTYRSVEISFLKLKDPALFPFISEDYSELTDKDFIQKIEESGKTTKEVLSQFAHAQEQIIVAETWLKFIFDNLNLCKFPITKIESTPYNIDKAMIIAAQGDKAQFLIFHIMGRIRDKMSDARNIYYELSKIKRNVHQRIFLLKRSKKYKEAKKIINKVASNPLTKQLCDTSNSAIFDEEFISFA